MQPNRNNKPNHNINCSPNPASWNTNNLNGMPNNMSMGQMMPVNYMNNPRSMAGQPQYDSKMAQYQNMQQLPHQQTMMPSVPNNGMQMQSMGMQAKNFNHPVNCPCRTAQLPTFPPQPSGIPMMKLGGAEMYPIANMNCMTPVGMNGQMCVFGSNYSPQSYIEPGMYVDPAQWKEICKQQQAAGHGILNGDGKCEEKK